MLLERPVLRMRSVKYSLEINNYITCHNNRNLPKANYYNYFMWINIHTIHTNSINSKRMLYNNANFKQIQLDYSNTEILLLEYLVPLK